MYSCAEKSSENAFKGTVKEGGGLAGMVLPCHETTVVAFCLCLGKALLQKGGFHEANLDAWRICTGHWLANDNLAEWNTSSCHFEDGTLREL